VPARTPTLCESALRSTHRVTLGRAAPFVAEVRKFPPGAYRAPELETFISSPPLSVANRPICRTRGSMALQSPLLGGSRDVILM